jgi:hypothetical protein
MIYGEVAAHNGFVSALSNSRVRMGGEVAATTALPTAFFSHEEHEINEIAKEF